MKKYKPTFGRARLLIVTAFLLVMSNLAFSQAITCSNFTSLPTNGNSVVINGVTVSVTYTGSIGINTTGDFTLCSGETVHGSYVHIGGMNTAPASAPFSYTMNFSQPVNNLILVFYGGGILNNTSSTENFIFNSNGGAVSIASPLNSNCTASITGNQIFIRSNGVGTGGGGLFRVTSPSNFTSLTMSGNGGSLGTWVGFCESSIVPECSAGTAGSNQTIASGTAPAALNLTGSTGTIQWQMSTDNVTFTNAESGGNAASYSPGVLTATRYYRAVVTSGSCTSTSNVVTITVLPCNAGSTQVPLNGSTLFN